ncbi:MAG: hypothetical protein K0B08_02405 [Bacteroidales bacterium]|nr:hypothetical protein [Bacteroidales bacterium]
MRLLSIWLMLFAHMILLAHNAIPHHHHPFQVCLINLHHHAGEDSSHSHGNELPSQDHDGAERDLPCILKQILAVPPNQIRLDNSGNNHQHFNDPGTPFEITWETEHGLNYRPIGLLIIFSSVPNPNPPPSYYISSYGLRAPPVS